jgi:hypothetical protein
VATIAWQGGGDDRLARWLGVSFGLHLLFALAGFLYGYVKPLPPPIETPVTVEFTAPVPPQQAQGERPAPAPAPIPAPAPPDPTPAPPDAQARPEPPQPAPPPPPPPPAPPAPAPPVPPAPAQPAQPPPPTPPQPAQPRPDPVPLPPPPAPTPQPAPAPPPRPTPPAPQPAPTPPRLAQPAPQPTPPAPQQSQAPPRPDPIPLPPPPAPPAPQPAPTAGTGQTPPVQRPQENSSSLQNTLERLRAQQAQQQAPTARPNPQAGRPAAGGGAPTGAAPLTQGEIRGIADQITECWSVDSGMLGLDQIVVELRVQLDAQGNVRNVGPGDRGVPSDQRARAVYESARRALLSPQCNPLKVPADKYRTVMESTFRFNPRGLVR